MDALGLQPVEMGQRIDHAPPLAVPFDGAQTVWPFEGASQTCDARGHAAISTFICRHSAAIAPIVSSACVSRGAMRSEEHTSELQSLMRISYAVFCLKKKKKYKH